MCCSLQANRFTAIMPSFSIAFDMTLANNNYFDNNYHLFTDSHINIVRKMLCCCNWIDLFDQLRMDGFWMFCFTRLFLSLLYSNLSVLFSRVVRCSGYMLLQYVTNKFVGYRYSALLISMFHDFLCSTRISPLLFDDHHMHLAQSKCVCLIERKVTQGR